MFEANEGAVPNLLMTIMLKHARALQDEITKAYPDDSTPAFVIAVAAMVGVLWRSSEPEAQGSILEMLNQTLTNMEDVPLRVMAS